MSECLVEAFSTKLESQSGATVRALSVVGEPYRWSNQYGTGWKVVVGDAEALGNKSDSAPRGTLRAFYDYLEGNLESTGRVIPYTPWAQIPNYYKGLLEQGRRAGMFGGRGPNYANYAWIQDAGNAKADITATHFIEEGKKLFESRTSGYLREWRSMSRA
jgi:hypothetical protein